MSNMGFKILAKFCQEKEVTNAHKEGILFGMHIMALQTEKWLDNEDHSMAYRMDTWDQCGFSGWREIYEHTKDFLEAKQPEESEQEMKERLGKNYEKVYAEKYEQPEESDVSDMEVTDDEDDFQVVDNEDEDEDEDDDDEEGGEDWTPYTYENVEYLVGPEADLGRVVLETEDYQPVGVFEDDKIVFEDNLQVANHFQRVRESTVPEDPEEAYNLITNFLEDNYGDLSFNGYKESTCPYGWSMHVFKEPLEFTNNYGKYSVAGSFWFYFGVEPSYVSLAPKRTNVLGKDMGKVMKEIESLL